MAFFGTHTGSVNLGGASTFISSSNGSSVEIGASTQVLIMSGGGASSLDPRNFADVNFFVSGSPGSSGTTYKGTALFGGDVSLSGSINMAGAIRSNPVQYWYLQNTYPTNPIISFTGLQGNPYLSTEIRSSNIYLGYTNGRTRVGSQLQSPSAHLHITSSGGAVGYAPLKFDSGSLLATPEAGAVEFNGNNLFLTTGSIRRSFLLAGDVTGSFNDVSSGLVTTASVSFAGTQGAAYFASRSVGSSTGGDVFFYVSGTARSGHVPAQGFLAKRALFNGDVVTSGTLQMLGAGYTSTIGSDTLLFVSGGTGTKGVATSRGTSVFAGDLHISGNTFLGTVAEAMATTGSALQGTLTFNTAGQSVFYVSGTTGNITANFTNVPVFDGRVVSTNVILSQSAAGGFIVSAVQINSVASTILWANGVTPTANAGKHDVFGFSLIRSGTVWTTLGQMSTYG